MKGKMIYRRSMVLTVLLVALVFLLTQCINQEEAPVKDKIVKQQVMPQYAGAASCAGCHKTIYESHVKTAHVHTSEPVTGKNIRGSFIPGHNTVDFTTGGSIAMEENSNSFFQVVYVNGVEKKRQRFDIIFGSGTKGQSFATWKDNHLLQLPITYFTSANQWSNSPGYPNKILLNRIITSRCLECHATFAQKISAPSVEAEEYDKTNMILGVTCEKCHGPAAAHVTWQTQHPEDTIARFVINPSGFNRTQSLDMCALCHGGRLEKTKPSFSFASGDKLSDYFLIDSTPGNADMIDVHGNQYGLLTASKCFRNSQSMTCMTCHDPHKNEAGATALFSQRCMSCHNNGHANTVNCKLGNSIGKQINTLCTDCHMPERPSKAIAVMLQGQDTLTPAMMHTHLVKNYPDATETILQRIKKNNRSTTFKQ